MEPPALFFAHVFFSSVFVIWHWYVCSMDSFASFATQVRENAKVLRPTVSYRWIERARRWWGVKMVIVLGVPVVVYWGTYRWVIGRGRA